MNCRKINSLLSAYIDGELTGTEQIEVRRHLRGCNGCEEEHDSLQQTKQILARLSTRNPDPVLEDRILQRIAEEAGRPVPKLDLRGWWGLLAEPDRAALRSGAVFSVFALAALLYFRLPMHMPAAVSGPNPSLVAGQINAPKRSQIEHRMLEDMLKLHNVGGSEQPVSVGIVPVSNNSEGALP